MDLRSTDIEWGTPIRDILGETRGVVGGAGCCSKFIQVYGHLLKKNNPVQLVDQSQQCISEIENNIDNIKTKSKKHRKQNKQSLSHFIQQINHNKKNKNTSSKFRGIELTYTFRKPIDNSITKLHYRTWTMIFQL
jgi:hypothetical protein